MSRKRTPRELAYEALLAMEKDGRQSHLVLQDVRQREAKQAYPLTAQEKAFFLRLVQGVLEYRLQLDYLIGSFSQTPVRKMKRQILLVLELGVYQILYMDSVPDHAAVSESVKLAAAKGFGTLRGFVNGVLRTVVREKADLVWPDPAKEPVRYLAVRYSLAEDIVQVWLKRFGQEKTEAVCRAFLQDRPLCVHVFPDVVSEEFDRERENWYTPCPLTENAFFLRQSGPDLTALPGFREGRIYLQDISSQLAVKAAGIGPRDKVLDLCAAPGGKSLLAAACCAEAGGSVLARDRTEEKCQLIRENARRCQRKNILVEAADATVFDPALEEQFDVVIADLPCSGFGVCGRKPEIKYKAYAETTAALAALQRRILPNAVRYLRPGGILLYATCTIARNENEDNADWLREHFGLKPVDLRPRLPEQLACVPTASRGYLQLLPSDGPWDGFFFAVFRKG